MILFSSEIFVVLLLWLRHLLVTLLTAIVLKVNKHRNKKILSIYNNLLFFTIPLHQGWFAWEQQSWSDVYSDM